MLKRYWILLLLCGAPVFAGGPNSPVTVLLEFDHPYSDLSLAEMEREAGAVLKGTGLTFNWKTEDSVASHAEFKSLLVFKMKGRCAMDIRPELIDERGPLGMAYVSDGQVLSFGQIECDRVKKSVQRILPPIHTENQERLYGRALGRVVAHEMYHMLSGQTEHAKSGLAQPSLTADELTSNRFYGIDTHPNKK